MKPNRPARLTRRRIIAASAASAFAFQYFPGRLFGQDAPSNKLNLAAIGVGGQGASNLKACTYENIVALCVVDWDYSPPGDSVSTRYPLKLLPDPIPLEIPFPLSRSRLVAKICLSILRAPNPTSWESCAACMTR